MNPEPHPATEPQDPALEPPAPACVMSFNASDPSGAGGVAGDVATIAAMGAHALPVVTSIIMRDTAEIFDHHDIDDDAVVEQARTILEDVTIAGWKVGFLGSAESVGAVAEVLSDYADVPLVAYMPSLAWLEEDQQQSYLDAFRELILPATEVLVGSHKTLQDFLLPEWDSERPPSARELAVAAGEHGTRYVLVTGIMLAAKGTEQFIDNVLASPQGALTGEKFERFDTAFVGAGDTLSAALAALLASGSELQAAVGEALSFLDQSLDAGFRRAWATSCPTASSGPCHRPRKATPTPGPKSPAAVSMTTSPREEPRAVSTNAELFARAQRVIPGGVNSPVRAFRAVGGTPRFIQRAQGAYMWDAEGRKYIDYIGSWGPMILGHGHPAVLEAVQKAAVDGFSFGAPTEREIELAEAIIGLVPSVEQVRLVSSGTEAGMSAIRLARGATGRSKIVKFEGCYHGHADALLVKAGSGPRHLRPPHQRRRAARGGAAHTGARIQQRRATRGDLCHAGRRDRLRDDRADLRQHELRPRLGALHATAARTLHAARRTACVRRGDDRLPRRARRRAERLRGPDSRLPARHQRVRQGHRRRHAAGGLRQHEGRDEPAGATRPGVPGRHAQRQPGGHRLRAGDAEGNQQAGFFDALSAATRSLVEGLAGAARNAGVPLVGDSEGGMFGFFFADTLPQNYGVVMATDKERFNRFFHAMLERGVYLAPALYEAGFVSAAHSRDDIAATVAASAEALAPG